MENYWRQELHNLFNNNLWEFPREEKEVINELFIFQIWVIYGLLAKDIFLQLLKNMKIIYFRTIKLTKISVKKSIFLYPQKHCSVWPNVILKHHHLLSLPSSRRKTSFRQINKTTQFIYFFLWESITDFWWKLLRKHSRFFFVEHFFMFNHIFLFITCDHHQNLICNITELLQT